MNIPGIRTIEYIEQKYISVPRVVSSDTPISIDNKNTIDFKTLSSVDGTVSLSSSLNETQSGQSHTISVNGFISGSAPTIREELTKLKAGKYVYKLTDINGQKYLVGNNEFFARLKYTFSNGPQPTSKIGYTFSISLTSPYDIVFLQ